MNSQHRSAIIGLVIAIAAVGGMYMLWPGTTLAPVAATEGTDTSADSSNTAAKQEAVPEKKTEKSPPAKTTKAPVPATATKPVTQGGSYENYSESAVGYAALGEVVLFFYSSSCAACVVLEKDIVTNAARIPKDVKILKVDFDSAADLKAKYGVTEPHKFIQVNSAGNRVTQWNLSSTLSDLLTRIVRY